MRRGSIGLSELKFDSSGGEGTFTGYGAVFGNVDLGGDVIVKGAFRDTLRAWKSGQRSIKMLWQHAMGMSAEDAVPIGKWLDMEEDEHGLKVKGQLIALDTDKGRRLHAALKAKQIDQMSIGYVTVDSEFDRRGDKRIRLLKKLDLLELSLVLFGMNPQTSVDSVKHDTGKNYSPRDCERILRDAGVPRELAKAIVAKGWRGATDQRDADGRATVDAIKARTASLSKFIEGI